MTQQEQQKISGKQLTEIRNQETGKSAAENFRKTIDRNQKSGNR